ncbi:DNA-processing protein DprA [Brochothrix campestris]|uniref:DNA protecting protein DprA n=1 Tax=Brochothrix campestris FSL F6-1037 TaxID=1265861 RepID=W7CZ02_9LIST|nr:DNA-processing protein DprA [Brochothrix campestris]EUJ42197.1 DNA protecting protein DprA [Brochothrix campestris FSL F6-1037]
MWTERKKWLFEQSHQFQSRTRLRQSLSRLSATRMVAIPKLALDYKAEGIVFITETDMAYPAAFRTMHDAPLYFYAVGNLTFLSKKIIAIVGSRQCSSSAEAVMKPIITALMSAEIVIVSGLALGIDAWAHRLTLREKGAAIAVLGSGMFRFHPRTNQRLFEQVLTKGLVISEYAPTNVARRWTFVERNRLISALSQGVWVVEATLKSGSLTTVDFALNEGKNIYASPGSPLNRHAEGCNQLIQDGAFSVLRAGDILETLG